MVTKLNKLHCENEWKRKPQFLNPNKIRESYKSFNDPIKNNVKVNNNFGLWSFLASNPEMGVGEAKVRVKKTQEPMQEIQTRYPEYPEIKTSLGNIFILAPLNNIGEEIKESKSMLELPEDWDSQGAYKIPLIIWERMAFMLASYSKLAYENFGVVIHTPLISPVSDGSIDLQWNTKTARMLVNIKNTAKAEAHFYGDFYNENTFKGKVEISSGLIELSFIHVLAIFRA